jgi:acetyl esterase
LIKTIVFIFAIFCCRVTVMASPGQTDSIQSKTFTFKNLPDTSLQLTVFYPRNTIGKKSVMILFHGGAWRIGNRKVMYPICEYFAKRGMVTVSASYRLIKGGQDVVAGKATCIKDAKSAVRWVKEHAIELNIDTTKMILGGGSAGGHLATMVALDTAINDLSDNKYISTSVKALTLFNPAYSVDEDSLVQPFRYAHSTAIAPMIMFFGTKDNFRKAGKFFLDSAINSKHEKGEIWYAPDQQHAFFNKEKGWLIAMCLKTDEFLVSIHLLDPTDTPEKTSGSYKFSFNEK